MKKLTLIIILWLGVVLKSNAHELNYFQKEDTTTDRVSSFDSKSIILQELFNSFTNSKFDSLNLFLDCYVDFYIETKEGYKKETGTDYKIIENLNSIFKNIDYSEFRISSAKNVDDEDVVLVTVNAKTSKGLPYYIKIFFVLNQNQAIYIIAIE